MHSPPTAEARTFCFSLGHSLHPVFNTAKQAKRHTDNGAVYSLYLFITRNKKKTLHPQGLFTFFGVCFYGLNISAVIKPAYNVVQVLPDNVAPAPPEPVTEDLAVAGLTTVSE